MRVSSVGNFVRLVQYVLGFGWLSTNPNMTDEVWSSKCKIDAQWLKNFSRHLRKPVCTPCCCSSNIYSATIQVEFICTVCWRWGFAKSNIILFNSKRPTVKGIYVNHCYRLCVGRVMDMFVCFHSGIPGKKCGTIILSAEELGNCRVSQITIDNFLICVRLCFRINVLLCSVTFLIWSRLFNNNTSFNW